MQWRRARLLLAEQHWRRQLARKVWRRLTRLVHLSKAEVACQRRSHAAVRRLCFSAWRERLRVRRGCQAMAAARASRESKAVIAAWKRVVSLQRLGG